MLHHSWILPRARGTETTIWCYNDTVSKTRPLTVVCMATYEKGQEFMRACHAAGCRVLLVTAESLRGAAWPREALANVFYIPAEATTQDLLKGIAGVARREHIDRIVALDDFDVETAALMREHLRVPGMGDTTARYFRDKLAMRVKVATTGLPIPGFVHALNDETITRFTETVAPPWLLKPRSQASAIGISRLDSADALWSALDTLGDRRSFYLIEEYVPGDIYHVDAIVSEREVVFAAAHKYGRPPMDVAHHGGIFVTRTMDWDADETQDLLRFNRALLSTLGFVRGVSHTEFIRGRHDGRFYFLETSARVGGAHIVDVVEAATGLNLWTEWARIEIAGEDGTYSLPPHRRDHAGIVLSLARQEAPDTSAYTDPEIVLRIVKSHHAGLIVASPDRERVEALLDEYGRRFMSDFYATAPLPDKPSN
jgi:biotin carboxylase